MVTADRLLAAEEYAQLEDDGRPVDPASQSVRRYDADQPGLVLPDDAELTFPEPLSGLRIRVKR